jgi:hypothetical protein
MIPSRLIYGALGVLLLLGLIYGFGEARYQQGRSDKATEEGERAAAQVRSAVALQADSRKRLASVTVQLNAKEREYYALMLDAKNRDPSYVTWLNQRVHPSSAVAYDWLRDSTADSAGATRRP